ncbi:MAG: ferric reductase-like transmembrane domain-containing protein [Gammaproteobacteria bacterium]|nr:ferric reductase-like transmembrane domain-containing protein [Gammaproteobacteria bacterium]
MSAQYKTVNWNRNKRVYDLWLWIGIVLYLVLFTVVTLQTHSGADALSMPIVLMRAFSTCGFLMLTIILCIGPAARISDRFLPLLYNRRHFGVSMFIIALLHSALAIFWYHSFGVVNPLVSVFTSGGSYSGVSDIPFQALGAIALVLLFLLAATSHDYWNANLGAPLWKWLHMLVYPAYALLVLHIIFGALQQDNTGLLPWMVLLSVTLVGGLHAFAALKRSGGERELSHSAGGDAGSWVDVCEWDEIENNRATTIDIGNEERIAVFRFDETRLCAIANACQHQNGPLGEGCVKNGLIVCPWHGYEYRPEDGCSPPPFTEKVETYDLRLKGKVIQINPVPVGRGAARPVIDIGSSAGNGVGRS